MITYENKNKGASHVLDKYDKENVIKLLYLLKRIKKPEGEKPKINYSKLRKAWVQIDHMKLVIV